MFQPVRPPVEGFGVSVAPPLGPPGGNPQVPMNAITSNERGFGLTELVGGEALLGILTPFAVPHLLSYYQSSSLTAGAEQLAAVMNRARHLAISRNTSVCV